LSKLAADLGSGQQPNLLFGSDEERALTKAIKEVFPLSSNLL